MTRVLVLGATGFIGGHIAQAALERGWEVHGLRRRRGATGHINQADVIWHDGDLDQPESLPQAFEGSVSCRGLLPSKQPKRAIPCGARRRTNPECARCHSTGRGTTNGIYLNVDHHQPPAWL